MGAADDLGDDVAFQEEGMMYNASRIWKTVTTTIISV